MLIDVKIPGAGYYDSDITITTFAGCKYKTLSCPTPCTIGPILLTRTCDNGSIMFTPNPPCTPSP